MLRLKCWGGHIEPQLRLEAVIERKAGEPTEGSKSEPEVLAYLHFVQGMSWGSPTISRHLIFRILGYKLRSHSRETKTLVCSPETVIFESSSIHVVGSATI